MKVADLFEGVKSGNMSNGYSGHSSHENVKDRDKKFQAMHDALSKTFTSQKLFGKVADQSNMVRDFLDSSHGRHLGDTEKHSGLDSSEFKKEAISRFQAFAKKYRPEDYA